MVGVIIPIFYLFIFSLVFLCLFFVVFFLLFDDQDDLRSSETICNFDFSEDLGLEF